MIGFIVFFYLNLNIFDWNLYVFRMIFLIIFSGFHQHLLLMQLGYVILLTFHLGSEKKSRVNVVAFKLFIKFVAKIIWSTSHCFRNFICRSDCWMVSHQRWDNCCWKLLIAGLFFCCNCGWSNNSLVLNMKRWLGFFNLVLDIPVLLDKICHFAQ